jgi:hypothetical protein
MPTWTRLCWIVVVVVGLSMRLAHGGLEFNGTTQYLVTTSPPVTDEPITVCAWARPDSTAGTSRYIFFVGTQTSASTDGEWMLRFTSTTTQARKLDDASVTNTGQRTTTVVAIVWQHVCGVFAANNSIVAWHNGTGGTAGTTSVADPTVNAAGIGARQHNTTTRGWFDGRLAHVAMWNVALTALEIGALASGVHPLCVRRDAVRSYMPLYEAVNPHPDFAGLHSWVPTNAPTVTTGPPVASGACGRQ